MDINIPPISYFKKAKDILYGKTIDIRNIQYGFNRARKACFNSEDLKKLINSSGINNFYEISAGTSDKKAYREYLNQICVDIKSGRYYRDYTTAKGNLLARKSLAFFESLKLSNAKYYTEEDICLTEGATGAITMVFEYIKDKYPDSEVLIPVPNYYIYTLAAKYFCLKFKEIIPETVNNEYKSFISIDSLIKNISSKTKLIVITNPTNPSGEVYSYSDLTKILSIGKEKNILILVDELFSELVFEKKDYVCSGEIASQIDALNNLVIVKGYSKNKNLAAFRIGYLLSKNTDLLESAARIAEQRHCFPVASNFTGFLCLDAFIQSVNSLLDGKRGASLEKTVKLVRNQFKYVDFIKEANIKKLTNLSVGYKKYLVKILKFYSERFDESLDLLKDEIVTTMPKKSAFNTLVKIKDINNINFFDFLLNLYLLTGVKIEIGPGFGLTQRDWESNPALGFWLRITYARDRQKLTAGIRRLLEFKNLFMNKPEQFLQTNLRF